MLQLRYSLTIAVVLMAVMMSAVRAGTTRRIVDIGAVTHDDEGPTGNGQSQNGDLARQMQDIEKTKTDLKWFLKQEMKGLPVDQPAKSKVIDRLQAQCDQLVETMCPDISDTEMAARKTYVMKDLIDQSGCEADAELKNVAPNCVRNIQRKVEEAMKGQSPPWQR